MLGGGSTHNEHEVGAKRGDLVDYLQKEKGHDKKNGHCK